MIWTFLEQAKTSIEKEQFAEHCYAIIHNLIALYFIFHTSWFNN